jgi:hypothetical protein
MNHYTIEALCELCFSERYGASRLRSDAIQANLDARDHFFATTIGSWRSVLLYATVFACAVVHEARGHGGTFCTLLPLAATS